jgi:hypothetical protein
MALHGSPTILERALRALQEYERSQTRVDPGAVWPLELPPTRCPAVSADAIHAETSNAEREAATSQIFLWVGVRCVERRNDWGSEKYLWHDYVGWCQQQKLTGVSRKQFGEIIDLLFTREMDGWCGIALAVDIEAADRYIM